ncbi:MAG: META domain-containing protein [Fusobacteriaceae bacterium]
MKKILALILFTTFFVLMGCSSTLPKDNGVGFVNKKFENVSPYKKLDMSISFSENRVFGRSGLNNYSGTYQKVGDTIKVSLISVTRMAGTPEEMEAEKVFLAVLSKCKKVEISGTTLTLYGENNVVLKFEQR